MSWEIFDVIVGSVALIGQLAAWTLRRQRILPVLMVLAIGMVANGLARLYLSTGVQRSIQIGIGTALLVALVFEYKRRSKPA